MPDHASPAFLIWHDAARSGDWTRLLAREASRDVRVALRALQDLPPASTMLDLYRDRLTQVMGALEDGFLERFGVASRWDGS